LPSTGTRLICRIKRLHGSAGPKLSTICPNPGRLISYWLNFGFSYLRILS
jgi:hypothetical protein